MALPTHIKRIMPYTVIATPGSEGAMGGWTASGDPVITMEGCSITVKDTEIRNRQGEVQVSGAHISTSDVYVIGIQTHRFTLPDNGQFDPLVDIEALRIKSVSGATGPSHQVIYLP